jgi:hypothetical protein
MGELIKWLTHDDRKDLFELLLALVLNILFIGLIAPVLWLLDRQVLALSLARGYGVLWLVIGGITVLIRRMQRLFRVDLYERANTYVISNLAVSCFLQTGWSAFAALAVRGFIAGAPAWIVIILYLVGILSCLIAFFAVSSLYQGAIYKLVSLPLALAGFLVFSVWPATGRALYGWFFRLF